MGAFVTPNIRNSMVTCGINGIDLSTNMTPAKKYCYGTIQRQFRVLQGQEIRGRWFWLQYLLCYDSTPSTYQAITWHKNNIKAFPCGHMTRLLSDIIHWLQVTLLGTRKIHYSILRLTRYLSIIPRLLLRRLSQPGPLKKSGLIGNIFL